MEVRVEVGKLVGQDVRVGKNIEDLLAEALLHLDDVLAESVFASQLARHREVVNLLVIVHRLINVGLYALARPHYVPFIALCLAQAIRLHDSLDKLSVGLHHLEKHVELGLLVLAWLRVAEHAHAIAVDLQSTKISFQIRMYVTKD